MTLDVLIQGNAKYISLANESVHCCICSPPYWGLRDYGTAQWVGGDAECDHVAFKKLSLDSGLRNDGRKHKGLYPGEKATEIVQQYRGTCHKCGATRIDNQLGLEATPEEYVANMVAVFREVWRVLHPSGVVWLNLGDSYAGSNCGSNDYRPDSSSISASAQKYKGQKPGLPSNLKPKDLVGIPWRVAFALQADGWWLRQDIIWSKPNPMPESVTDRCTKSHEYVFLLAKSQKYYYDQEAVREPHAPASLPRALRGLSEDNKWNKGAPGSTAHTISQARKKQRKAWEAKYGGGGSGFDGHIINPAGRNKRSVWHIATRPYKEAHFATYPPTLVKPCVLAGTSEKGCCPECGSPWERVTKNRTRFEGGSGKAGRTPDEIGGKWGDRRHGKNILLGPVTETTTLGWQPTCTCNAGEPVPCTILDPFNGAGTTGLVALQYGRRYIGIDISAEYLRMSQRRLDTVSRQGVMRL